MISDESVGSGSGDDALPSSINAAARGYLQRVASRPRIDWPRPSESNAWSALQARLDRDMAAFYRQRNAGFAEENVRHPGVPSDVWEIRSATRAGLFSAIDPAMLYVHGGAYVMGGGQLAAEAAREWAHALGDTATVYAVDYRLPPEHVFPAALDDVVAALSWVMSRHARSPVAAVGVSAGGGLLASALLKRRDLGLPVPAAAVFLMPECDLTESGDSFEVLREADVVLKGSLMNANRLYAGGADLAHPYLSAIYGDVRGAFPPSLLISGTRDLFLSNTVRLHRLLRRAGVAADLVVHEAMPHGGFPGSPENDEMLADIVGFLEHALRSKDGGPVRDSARPE